MEYQLHFRYGLTVPNTPGLGNGIVSAERKGVWRIGRGTKANGAAVVYELDGAVAFQQVSEDVLHVLHEDRTLMSGNGGWSYTLSRDDRAEPLVDPRQAPAPDDVEPRTISPVSTGPAVFGVFEGRTPCQGIARELQITAWPGCAKTKWRVTLYQNPATREPTTYKIEGTLLRTAREGSWRIERGRATDASATVYTLAPAQGQRAMMLLRGDDNVIFFLSQQRHPMTGHAQLGYTLDRRR
jgi:hypothetical protein